MIRKKIYGVYGASGFGREVLPFAREYVEKESDGELFFIDDSFDEKICNGCEVLSFDAFKKIRAQEKFVSIAIANHNIRRELAKKCIASGMKNWSLVATNVVCLDDVKMGEGVILCPFVTLTSNVRIGSYFHANLYSYVAHDCVIGDYVTFAPHVMCNGNVVIEDDVYIGSGAIIKQGNSKKRPIKIGKGATIAAGAFITKNVPDGVTMIGNPARILSRDSLKGKIL